MRKIAGLIAGLYVGAAGFAGGAWASAISQSPHNMRGGTGGVDICSYCHIRQDIDTTIRQLWEPEAEMQDGYSLFGSSANVGAVAETHGVRGVSLVCLSCHDASISIDIEMGSWSENPVAAYHPISVSYDAGAGLDFRSPQGGKVGELPLFSDNDPNGPANRVECPTCHNPHEIVFGRFLRVSNVASGLCRTCHNK